MKNNIWQEDLENLIQANWIPWGKFYKKTILVTGASGLIGTSLIKGLAYATQKLELNMRLLALVRDQNKALRKFNDIIANYSFITIIQGDVQQTVSIPDKIDFIIHGASPTASRYFVEHPVETIKTSVNGTIQMLELAKKNEVEGFVYLSSMEVYGVPQSEDLLTEKDIGYMNPLIVRNCYSESKRMCESLCVSYANEYNVPAMSIRLAQTFGPGVEKEDARVYAEFARCAINRKDICLLTEGSSKRCYLYTMDAVSAILTVLLNGEQGESYNAGNPNTYCSVKEMAQMVAHELAGDEITVKFSDDEKKCKYFSFPHFYNLDITRIMALGWHPSRGLAEMYQRMIEINEYK